MSEITALYDSGAGDDVYESYRASKRSVGQLRMAMYSVRIVRAFVERPQ